MGYQEVAYPKIPGGLNLRDQPDHVDPGFAIDLNNILFHDRGVITPRYGYGEFSAQTPATGEFTALHNFTKADGTKQIIAGDSTQIRVISAAGALVDSAQAFVGDHSIVSFGGPTATSVYVASSTNLGPKKWNGTAWSTPTFGGDYPDGKYLAVTPWDNRMVSANFGGSVQGDNRSSVRFSEAGDPETWDSTYWFEDLTPGDGEQITGMIVWRNQLFVFKETKFYRFYGTTLDSVGNPTFEYTTIDTGVGLVGPKAVCANRDGVYFVDKRGVYKTTGQEPQYISDIIEPLFVGNVPSGYRGGAISRDALAGCIAFAQRERLYFSVPTNYSLSNNAILVYSPNDNWWSVWDLTAQAICGTPDDNDQDQFLFSSGDTIKRYAQAFTTDDDGNLPIIARLHWANVDYGINDVKVVREIKLWGKGALQFGVSKDFESNHENLKPVTFGIGSDLVPDTWGAGAGPDVWSDGSDSSDVWSGTTPINSWLYREAIRGTFFGLHVHSDGDGSPWQLDRITVHMRSPKQIQSTIGVD